jgi:hypothetical protein
MSSLFGLPGNNYGAETVVFVLSVALLALPLATLIAASLLEGLMRQRSGRRVLAPAPLSLRRFTSPAVAGRTAHRRYVGTIRAYRTLGPAYAENRH